MTNKIYFVDRSVIIKIRDKTLTADQEAMLRSIDLPSNRVSPLLACFEGQKGVLQTEEELRAVIERDTEILDSFFEFANTNDVQKIASPEHITAIINRQEERWGAYAEFVGFSQLTLFQPIGKIQIKQIQNDIAQEAIRLGIPLSSIFVLCALACLYQQKDAHEILKPSLKRGGTPKRVHNALQDLSAIMLYNTISMLLQQGPIKIATGYITFDGWVKRFMELTNVRGGALTVTNIMVSQVNFDLSQELFPKASKAEFESICELLGVIKDEHSYAPPWYPIEIRFKMNIPSASDE
ncbi:hypothetical protein [Pseudomonas kurunegalensis]|uniref:hypothetical protein n=1 Tax=Pseudomonas kurunegalensis TaxID=485880 RepID=UPI003557FAB7